MNRLLTLPLDQLPEAAQRLDLLAASAGERIDLSQALDRYLTAWAHHHPHTNLLDAMRLTDLVLRRQPQAVSDSHLRWYASVLADWAANPATAPLAALPLLNNYNQTLYNHS